MTNRDDKVQPGQNVKDRWWVDTDRKQREVVKRPSGPAGMSFFRAGDGYDQERAHARLIDLNPKLLAEANPPEGGWGYVQLAEKAYPERERDRIKKLVNLPAYARGAFVDSGRCARLIITGTPVGSRILELALNEAPSFDCWIDGEWVREMIFDDAEKAITMLRKLITEYLSPESLARWQELRVQA